MPKTKAKNNSLLLLPRILSILFALFLVIFSFDEFGTNQPVTQQIIGFVMHNIPTYLILIILAFSWRNNKIGAIGFFILGIVFTIFFQTFRNINIFVMISLPLLVISCLFALQIKKNLTYKKK